MALVRCVYFVTHRQPAQHNMEPTQHNMDVDQAGVDLRSLLVRVCLDNKVSILDHFYATVDH